MAETSSVISYRFRTTENRSAISGINSALPSNYFAPLGINSAPYSNCATQLGINSVPCGNRSVPPCINSAPPSNYSAPRCINSAPCSNHSVPRCINLLHLKIGLHRPASILFHAATVLYHAASTLLHLSTLPSRKYTQISLDSKQKSDYVQMQVAYALCVLRSPSYRTHSFSAIGRCDQHLADDY